MEDAEPRQWDVEKRVPTMYEERRAIRVISGSPVRAATTRPGLNGRFDKRIAFRRWRLVAIEPDEGRSAI